MSCRYVYTDTNSVSDSSANNDTRVDNPPQSRGGNRRRRPRNPSPPRIPLEVAELLAEERAKDKRGEKALKGVRFGEAIYANQSTANVRLDVLQRTHSVVSIFSGS